MSRTCPYCSSSEIDEDPSRRLFWSFVDFIDNILGGDATCMGCGMVLEESRIVSDVQFQETGGGAHEVIGKILWRNFKCSSGGCFLKFMIKKQYFIYF